MIDVTQKLTSRLLAWDWDAWNHPHRAIILTPVFILIGGAISILLPVQLAHDGFTIWPDGIMTITSTITFTLGALFIGYIVLAFID